MRRRLILLACVLFAGAAGRPNIAAVPISRLAEPWWKARFEAKQQELRAGPVNILWLGDSITQNWEKSGPPAWRDFAPAWQHYYGGRHAVNLGFKGDSTCHLLWRLQNGELDGIHPRVAVLLIGANNFGHVHTDARQTFAGIEAVLALLRAREPQMRVILVGVLPSIRSPWITANTDALDRMLRDAYARGDAGTRYVDASAIVERDGMPDPARFLDPRLTPPEKPLHPDAEAEAQLAALIEPTLAADLGEAPRPPYRP